MTNSFGKIIEHQSCVRISKAVERSFGIETRTSTIELNHNILTLWMQEYFDQDTDFYIIRKHLTDLILEDIND